MCGYMWDSLFRYCSEAVSLTMEQGVMIIRRVYNGSKLYV